MVGPRQVMLGWLQVVILLEVILAFIPWPQSFLVPEPPSHAMI